MNEDDELRVSVRIAASPAEVFPYLVDSSLLVRWIGDRADLDPVAGGDFALDMSTTQVRGRYLVVDPPHRVVFTWGVAGSEELPAGSTTVQIALTADGDGTVVELTHRGLPSGEVFGHRSGWIRHLDHLRARAPRS